jgi:hypothetical protein
LAGLEAPENLRGMLSRDRAWARTDDADMLKARAFWPEAG